MNRAGVSPTRPGDSSQPGNPAGGVDGGAGRLEELTDRSRIATENLGGVSQAFRPIGLPPIVLRDTEGRERLCPYLLDDSDLADLFRLADSKTRFPRATIARYRQLGLRTVRIGRRRWYRLDDVLRFFDERQRAGGMG